MAHQQGHVVYARKDKKNDIADPNDKKKAWSGQQHSEQCHITNEKGSGVDKD
jgi:hypothetical protein